MILRDPPADGFRSSVASYALRSRHTGELIARIDDALRIVYVDPGLLSFFGYPGVAGDDLAVLANLECLIELDDDFVARWHELVTQPGATDRLEICLCAADGSPRWARMDLENHLHEDQDPCLWVDALDVTESRDAEDRYRDMVAHNDRLSGIIEATSDLVVVTDADGAPLYLNRAAQEFYGLVDVEVTAAHLAERLPPWVMAKFQREVVGALVVDGIWTGELALLRHGIEIPVGVQCLAHRGANGEVSWLSMVARDISERKRFESRLAAPGDPRPADRAAQPRAAARPSRAGAVPRPGAPAPRWASSSSTSTTSRWSTTASATPPATGSSWPSPTGSVEALRPGDTVARFGGDEFVVLCEDLDDQGDAVAVAERVAGARRPPFEVERRRGVRRR